MKKRSSFFLPQERWNKLVLPKTETAVTSSFPIPESISKPLMTRVSKSNLNHTPSLQRPSLNLFLSINAKPYTLNVLVYINSHTYIYLSYKCMCIHIIYPFTPVPTLIPSSLFDTLGKSRMSTQRTHIYRAKGRSREGTRLSVHNIHAPAY